MEYDGHGRSIIALRIGRDAGKKGMAVVINTNTGLPRRLGICHWGDLVFFIKKKEEAEESGSTNDASSRGVLLTRGNS